MRNFRIRAQISIKTRAQLHVEDNLSRTKKIKSKFYFFSITLFTKKRKILGQFSKFKSQLIDQIVIHVAKIVILAELLSWLLENAFSVEISDTRTAFLKT